MAIEKGKRTTIYPLPLIDTLWISMKKKKKSTLLSLTHKKVSETLFQCETCNLLCCVCGCLPYIHSHAAFSLMLKRGNLAEAAQEQPSLNEAQYLL
jgi:hypothetical protein